MIQFINLTLDISPVSTKLIMFCQISIPELKSQVHSKSNDFDNLAVKAAACGRTLAVTEQELRLVLSYIN